MQLMKSPPFRIYRVKSVTYIDIRGGFEYNADLIALAISAKARQRAVESPGAPRRRGLFSGAEDEALLHGSVVDGYTRLYMTAPERELRKVPCSG